MNTKQRVLAFLAAISVSIMIATPAQAEDPFWYDNCDNDNICFYEELVTGYELPVMILGYDAPGQCYNFYDSNPEFNHDDVITAWANYWDVDPPVELKFYVDSDCDDGSGASSWTNQATGEFWGGIATLGISSVETRYVP